jgi:hypothetical protein
MANGGYKEHKENQNSASLFIAGDNFHAIEIEIWVQGARQSTDDLAKNARKSNLDNVLNQPLGAVQYIEGVPHVLYQDGVQIVLSNEGLGDETVQWIDAISYRHDFEGRDGSYLGSKSFDFQLNFRSNQPTPEPEEPPPPPI